MGNHHHQQLRTIIISAGITDHGQSSHDSAHSIGDFDFVWLKQIAKCLLEFSEDVPEQENVRSLKLRGRCC